MVRLKVFIIILLGAFIPHILRYIKFQGYHVLSITNKQLGNCWKVPGTEHGSEDIEMLPGGKLLVTTGWEPSQDLLGKGRILLVDLSQSQPTAVPVPIIGDLDLGTFNPLGISKWITRRTKKITIFVANQDVSDGLGTVEKFTFDDESNTLHHVQTIGKDLEGFYLVNAVAPISETEFYYTNIFSEYPSLEQRFLLPWSGVHLYTGSGTVKVDSGIAGPNGLVLSLDGKFLYMNSYFGQFMRCYERNEDNTLKYLQDHHLPISGDNLAVDAEGHMWVAGHVTGHSVFAAFIDRSVHVPSKVLKLTMADGVVTSSRDILVDDGTQHSIASIAWPHRDRLLVGSVFHDLHMCDRPQDN